MTTNSLRQETCLVTGVAGFIGSHLAEALIARGYSVIGIDAFVDYYSRATKEANLAALRRQPAFQFIEADLRYADLPLTDVDYVFHQAGQPGVRASWGQSFSSYMEHNMLATQRLLEAVKGSSVRRLIYASSSSVYGTIVGGPAREDSLPSPISPYGVTKLAGEYLCRLYSSEYGVPTVSLRYFSVYGPRQRPDMAFHKFIRAFLLGEPITIYGDGEQSRDFTYVGDIVSANLAVMTGGHPGAVYNIGGGVHVTVNEVLRLLERITGRQTLIRYLERQPGDAAHTFADTNAASKDLGFMPAFPLAEGLREQTRWMTDLLAVSEVR